MKKPWDGSVRVFVQIHSGLAVLLQNILFLFWPSRTNANDWTDNLLYKFRTILDKDKKCKKKKKKKKKKKSKENPETLEDFRMFVSPGALRLLPAQSKLFSRGGSMWQQSGGHLGKAD
jgi:hypothetical protein